MSLYWTIGKSISEKVNTANWGSSVVEELSKDLKEEFPNQKGFSRSNLFSMKKWFEFYSQSEIDIEKIQQLVGQIPWGHNVVIISKSKNIEEAIFYSNKTIENNWSRSVLLHQIELNLYERHGKAITNFTETLPTPHSELTTETLKDPYKFDFLTLQEKALEKDIEIQLVKHITSFLLELGTGFSFVGQQVPVKIDNQDFYIDLLFYHIKLKCYVVVELKAIEFKAEFAGKMNLYLSAIDDSLKTKAENPTIGLLLCKSKSEIIAEYALRGMTQPIGIAEYEINNAIPKEIKTELPTIEEIELATTKAIRNAGDSNE
jgi:predicted nuclease of restriction endonuclease-like (RecB) superfamily